MPIYEYWCPSCKEESQRMTSIAARDQQKCTCDTQLERTEIASAQVNRTDSRWYVRPVFTNGSKGTSGLDTGRVRKHKGFM